MVVRDYDGHRRCRIQTLSMARRVSPPANRLLRTGCASLETSPTSILFLVLGRCPGHLTQWTTNASRLVISRTSSVRSWRLLAITLICCPKASMEIVHATLDELEGIRARRIAEMVDRVQKSSTQVGGPVKLTDSDFDSFVRSNRLVVVDCWAAWCYPCRLIAPVVEELASEYGSVALFAKLNVDENPLTASVYGIQSIPTILIIKDGVEVDRIVGAMPKEQIEAVLKKHL